MNNTYEIALAEVFEILRYLPKEQQVKIPEKLMDFIKKEKQDDYEVKVKEPLNIQDYSKEAIVLLGMIYIDFLCSQEEKNAYKKKEEELKEQHQKELIEKYSVDNLFKQKDTINSINDSNTKQELALVKTNKNWFTKAKEFFNRIIKNIIK